MNQTVRSFLIRCLRKLLAPKRNLSQELILERAKLAAYKEAIAGLPLDERANFFGFSSIARDMIEARLMGGSGPKFGAPAADLVAEGDRAVTRICERALDLRERLIDIKEGSPSISSQGAFGDIELALQNVEWRREINISWLEFSRWGIQQIILISRLYYIKNPLMRRAIDVCAAYVFGRGVEITTDDYASNDILQDFFERNKATLGPTALLDLERRKYYDGNIYFAFFADPENTGQVDVRTIDAVEIAEIVTDPKDADKSVMFKRSWREKTFDPATGTLKLEQRSVWHPALGLNKTGSGFGDKIGTDPINWDVPVLHRICGAVAKWSMGCPIVYPAVEWAKTSKEFLEACLTLAQSHAQFAWKVTTKGGQAALAGIKQQLQTQVDSDPNNSLWDTNPTAVDASVFASGPGTTLAPMNVRGQGLDPSEVKEFRNMIGMVVGIPPTWLGDMETANLSTATTLDRPTELGFRSKQVQWEEDFATIAKYVLETSAGASNGALRETLAPGRQVRIVECRKVLNAKGQLVYEAKSKQKDPNKIQVRITFPEIREGDLPQLVKAIVESMTLDNKGGQIVGIDEREGVRMLYESFGVENAEEILESQYPSKGPDKYDPNRTKADLPAPLGKLLPNPGGEPQLPGGQQPTQATAKPPDPTPVDHKESYRTKRLLRLIAAAGKLKR